MENGESPTFWKNISAPSSLSKNKPSRQQASVFAGFLLGLIFDPEDGDDMFQRNFGLPPHYRRYNAEDPVLQY
jgi:hypothetical protein